MEYRATLTRDDDTVLVSFPDLPGAHSFGNDEEDALAHGRDALITIIEALIKDRRAIPLPKEGRGPKVTVAALLAVKVALHNEMLAQKVTKAELGRRLHQHSEQIDRLVNVRHGSRLDQLEAAFSALGKRIDLNVHDAPRPHKKLIRTRRKGASIGVPRRRRESSPDRPSRQESKQ